MIKIKPKYSRKRIQKAGDVLKSEISSDEDRDEAMDVLSNWRAIHSYPINTFQATLREKLNHIDKDALVAQRLKRAPSIISKLQRFKKMNLARMQDIGGLRAIVKDIKKVRALEKNYKNSRFLHELVGEKDYISNPKDTGYRGIHLVYKYKNKKTPEYDGLHIELQIRTRLQHAWATAVETVGTFLDHSLKSSEGPDEWLSFFALTGSAFAILENENKVPGYEGISDYDTFYQVIREADRLDITNRLQLFSMTANHITNDKSAGSHHIVVLDANNKSSSIQSFGRRKLDEANRIYTSIEKDIENNPNKQVVLVATGSIEQLRKAYPNYFLDTHEFINKLNLIRRKLKKANN